MYKSKINPTVNLIQEGYVRERVTTKTEQSLLRIALLNQQFKINEQLIGEKIEKIKSIHIIVNKNKK